ncbi:MAG: NUDIX hydrolase [Anaerolineae bacterium]|nr:NUDIX hydrolase [Anaerolineae bacterium]
MNETTFMLRFESIHQLNNRLQTQGIDTTKWGNDGAKSVTDLWQELVTGESEIQEDPFLRIVRVVHIIIRDGDRILIEAQQHRKNQSRYRWFPPSEKLKHGEGHIEAAVRGLKEELQVNPNDIKILSVSPSPKQQCRESQSYPGLNTQYMIFAVEVEVDNLPREEFWTTEMPDEHDNPIRKHQWLWITPNNRGPWVDVSPDKETIENGVK